MSAFEMQATEYLVLPSTKDSRDDSSFVLCSVPLPKRKLTELPVEFARFLTRVELAFGGYTFEREVSGSWLDRATGISHNDNHLVISIAVLNQPVVLQFLKDLLAETAADLNELALFVAIEGGSTIFVWANLRS